MELSGLKLELFLFNDTESIKNSMKTNFLLDNIILDDTRRKKKKPIRLYYK